MDKNAVQALIYWKLNFGLTCMELRDKIEVNTENPRTTAF
jgi:hypothetical protein